MILRRGNDGAGGAETTVSVGDGGEKHITKRGVREMVIVVVVRGAHYV